MGRAVKFAVSMPEDVFSEMEEVRQKEGLSRSKLILEAIKLWNESKKTEELVRAYEEGYKRVPESTREIEGWEKASIEVFANEGWE